MAASQKMPALCTLQLTELSYATEMAGLVASEGVGLSCGSSSAYFSSGVSSASLMTAL